MPGSRKKIYLLIFSIILVFCAYPIAMGVAILRDSVAFGGVDAANYPKYAIPYAPIGLSLVLSTALLPLFARIRRRFAFWALAALALTAFFAGELFLETLVVYNRVADGARVDIVDWQMYLCVATPEVPASEYVVLLGEYSSAFKLHFYLISSILVLGVLGCAWGFYTLPPGDRARRRMLWAQLIAVAAFVGLCVLACFTAFFRVGSLLLSPLSASLMAGYFILFGVTFGLFLCAQFSLRRWLAVLGALATTSAMYAGELILLGGNLYRFGGGPLFRALDPFPLAPADCVVILLAGLLTHAILSLLLRRKGK